MEVKKEVKKEVEAKAPPQEIIAEDEMLALQRLTQNAAPTRYESSCLTDAYKPSSINNIMRQDWRKQSMGNGIVLFHKLLDVQRPH